MTVALDGVKTIFRRIKRMFKTSFISSISEVTKHESLMTETMMASIEHWIDMFEGDPPKSLKLPAIIASEVARAVTLEMKVELSGSAMGDFINEQFKPVIKDIRPNTEYACAGGGIVFKPYVSDEGIVTEIIHANACYPIAFNAAQKITSMFFVYRVWKGKKVYSRLEKHALNGTVYTITNKAYVSTYEESLGDECSLAEVEEWADIEPEVVLENIKAPLFSYFKIPVGNTIDIRSPLGVSVYSRACDLIHEADKQFGRLLWEYEGGELAIDASVDAFKTLNGLPVLPEGKERLYRTNDIDAVSAGSELLKAWNPTLRDSNYMAGLNRILCQIEDACSLARGTISDPNQVEKTATEMKITKQRSYALVSDIQTSLQTALDDLAYAMYCLAILYDLCPDGTYQTAYTWDDSIIIDAEAERQRDREDVVDGLMQKWEYRMKWYGETEEKAKSMIDSNTDNTDDEILGFLKEEEAKVGKMGNGE